MLILFYKVFKKAAAIVISSIKRTLIKRRVCLLAPSLEKKAIYLIPC